MASEFKPFSSLIDKNTAKRAVIEKRGISDITVSPDSNPYLFKDVGNGSTAKGQPKIGISSKIGGRPLLVDEVGTIRHEVATNARFNYSNISSKADRFAPPKWLVARCKDKNIPPYVYKVDKTERSAVDFTAYRYNTDCSLINRTKTLAKTLAETTVTYNDCFSTKKSQQRTQFEANKNDRGPRERPHDFLSEAGFPSQRSQLKAKKILKSPTSKWKWSDLADSSRYN